MVLVAAVARRLCYVVTRAGLVALVHLCFTHAMTLVSTFAEQLGSHPILDTVGFTSFVNLLLFSCYLVYYASCYVYQSMVDPPSGCVGRSAVMLLEEDKDIFSMSFPELAARCHAEAKLVYTHRKPSALLTTVPRMWYHVYALGFSLFVLSYSVHMASALPFLSLVTSCTMCSMCHHLRTRGGKSWLVCCAVYALLCWALALLWYKHAVLMQAVWLDVALPLAAPFIVHSMQQETSKVLQLKAAQVLIFGLPFLAMMSVCFLSTYLPLQQCSSLQSLVVEDIRALSNVTLVWPFLRDGRPAAVICVLLCPALLWLGMTSFTSAVLQPHKLVEFVSSGLLVLASKALFLSPEEGTLQAAVVLCSLAAVCTSCIAVADEPLLQLQEEPGTPVVEEEEEEATAAGTGLGAAPA